MGEIIREFIIRADSKGEELASFAQMLQNIVRLPMAIRSLSEKGIRIEGGKVVDHNYTGPVLEQVLRENRMIQTIPRSGYFRGKSVIVAPIQDEEGNVIAAIGLSDEYGALDLIDCLCKHMGVIEEVEKCMIERGMKPKK